MAILVVGGSGKNAGKTSLICGIVSALPELAWVAVKVTDHAHGKTESIWEETAAGQGSDTSRFLTAGARRAFLLTSDAGELADRLRELCARFEPGTNLIFESNRIVDVIQADLVLSLRGIAGSARKTSFERVAHLTHAEVALAERDQVIQGTVPLFQLASLERISPEMQRWTRARLVSH